VGLLEALDEFERWVLPGSMGTPHLLYLGLNSSPLPGAVLADLLISSLNNNVGAFHQSPAMTTCEEEVVRAFARLFGMADADGMFLPGGSFATLQAIVVARVKVTGGRAQSGLQLYTSEAAHFSGTHSDGRRHRSRGRGLDTRVGTRRHGRERARTAYSSRS
jgi:hypothetical protein